MIIGRRSLLAAGAALATTSAVAQPAQPVTIVTPFGFIVDFL
jgi:tripartite-type tricarboxylate transporter receptor subunit TctC